MRFPDTVVFMSSTLSLDGPAPVAVLPEADPRAALIDAAIETFRRRAFHEVRLEEVAASAGVELSAVTAEFPTLNELVVAVIEVWNVRRMTPILPAASRFGAVAFLRRIVVANSADPGLMRLISAMANVASTPDHPLAHVLRRQWIQFHAHVQRTLAHDIAVGREPSTMEPASGAEQLIAVYEGLQLQSMLRPDMNVLASYDRAVTRLRDGWSREYQPPIWEI